MWFNRKLTAFQHSLDVLEARLNNYRDDLKSEKSNNRRNLLEYAELGEKMRRLYLRIARRAKIETEESSVDPETESNSGRVPTSKEIRESIENRIGML